MDCKTYWTKKQGIDFIISENYKGHPCLYNGINFCTTNNTNSVNVLESSYGKTVQSLSMLSFLISPTIGYLSHYLFNRNINSNLSSKYNGPESEYELIEKIHLLIALGDIFSVPTTYCTIFLKCEPGISPNVMNNVVCDIGYIDLYFNHCCENFQKLILYNNNNIDEKEQQFSINFTRSRMFDNPSAFSERFININISVNRVLSRYNMDCEEYFYTDLFLSGLKLSGLSSRVKHKCELDNRLSPLLHSHLHVILAFMRRRCQHTRIRAYIFKLVKFVSMVLISAMRNMEENSNYIKPIQQNQKSLISLFESSLFSPVNEEDELLDKLQNVSIEATSSSILTNTDQRSAKKGMNTRPGHLRYGNSLVVPRNKRKFENQALKKHPLNSSTLQFPLTGDGLSINVTKK